MATLYEIESEIWNLLHAATGEASDLFSDIEIGDALNAAKIERDKKLASICAYIKNLKADSVAIKAERERLKLLDEAKTKRIERLESYIKYCEPTFDRWSNGIHTISWRKNPPSVKPTPDNVTESVPDQYANIKIVRTPDKNLIKQTIQEGGTVPGWHIEQEKSLQVR